MTLALIFSCWSILRPTVIGVLYITWLLHDYQVHLSSFLITRMLMCICHKKTPFLLTKNCSLSHLTSSEFTCIRVRNCEICPKSARKTLRNIRLPTDWSFNSPYIAGQSWGFFSVPCCFQIAGEVDFFYSSLIKLNKTCRETPSEQ